jgi:hypothetical protein
MTLASSDRATLSAQLSQLSEEQLRALLSTRPSASAIASTPVAVLSSTSVHAHASYRPLPNSSAGGPLSAMASLRCQSAITDHFRCNVQSHRSTPRGPSHWATITPGQFTVFRSQYPSPTPMTISSHAVIRFQYPLPAHPGRLGIEISTPAHLGRSTGVAISSHNGTPAHLGRQCIGVRPPAHPSRQSIHIIQRTGATVHSVGMVQRSGATLHSAPQAHHGGLHHHAPPHSVAVSFNIRYPELHIMKRYPVN